MLEDRNAHLPEQRDVLEELNRLTAIPVDAMQRALRYNLDSAEPLLLSLDDSKIAVGQAIREAMHHKGATVYHLHEETGLSCELIEDMMNGSGDLSDSEPLQKLEAALGVRLTHL